LGAAKSVPNHHISSLSLPSHHSCHTPSHSIMKRFSNILVISVAAFGSLAFATPTSNPDTGSGPNPDSDHLNSGNGGYHQPPPPYGYPSYPGLPDGAYPTGQEIRYVYVDRPHHEGHAHSAAPPHPHHPQHEVRPDEYLKANCSLEEVKKEREVCGPLDGVTENCEDIEVNYMKLTTEEACYDVTRTVCEELTEEEEREICTYEFQHVSRQENARGVEVKFLQTKQSAEVEVCEKKQVYGGYAGKTYEKACSKADQVTKVSSPSTTSKDVPVHVSGPEVVKTCITKRMKVPRIECKDEKENKCTMTPKLVDSVEKIQVCRYDLAKEECRVSKQFLPQQTCVETVEEKKPYSA